MRNGAALRAAPQLRELGLRGFQVESVAPEPGTRLASLPFNADTLSSLAGPDLARRARQAAERLDPHLVLAFGIWSMRAALAAQVASRQGARILLDLAHVETVTARETRGRLAAAVLRRLEGSAVSRADAVHVVSEEDRRRLLALFSGLPPSRVRVLPHGACTEPLHDGPAPPPGRPATALFVGRMSFRPNREAALFIDREVAPLFAGRIVLAGGGPPSSLRNVEARGEVDDLGPLYREATAVLAPVRTGSGVRNKVLEAAARWVPLVATARAVEGLGFEDGVHYLRGETPSELARGLERASTDAALAGRLARAAAENVRARHRWSEIGGVLAERVHSLAGLTS